MEAMGMETGACGAEDGGAMGEMGARIAFREREREKRAVI